MQNILRFPAISRLPLLYPSNGQLWTQTVIGRAPKATNTKTPFFEEVLWILPNVPLTTSRSTVAIFVTNQGLVSIRNISHNNIVKVRYESYLPFIKLIPNEEVFVTNRDLYRNLTVKIDDSVSFRVASYSTCPAEGTRIAELERKH